MNKTCNKCGVSKPLDEFYNHKDCKDGKRPDCKECVIKRRRIYSQEHREEIAERSKIYGQNHVKEMAERSKRHYLKNREKMIKAAKLYREENYERLAECARKRMGYISMYKNKSCAAYLGIVIGERLCRYLFKDVQIMPNNNPGFDIICNKGKKIDVKTGCIHLNHGKHSNWIFHIKKKHHCRLFHLYSF